MKKFNEKGKKAAPAAICVAQCLILACASVACVGKDSGMPQEGAVSNEALQETAPQESMLIQESVLIQETSQTQAPQSQEGQISLEDAKAAALADAGVTASDVVFTKEKSDYENGIAVYELEFYAQNAQYEYEINAVTGSVYSKDVDWHHANEGHGHHDKNEQDFIGAQEAKAIALAQEGFAEGDVTLLTCEFDYDDGIAVYEIEFYKDGREYEVTVSALDGAVLSYDMD